MSNETKVESKPEGAIAKVRSHKKAVPARVMTSFDELEEAMDRMFEGWLAPRGWLGRFRSGRPIFGEEMLEGWVPKMDVIDRDEEVLLRAEVPGVEKKDLEISLTDDSVTLKGQTRHEEKEEKGHYFRSEVSRGTFSRTVSLPAEVDTDKAKAEFKEGILELRMPKLQTSKRRTIKLE
jgi:HSP20 family protein